MAFYKNRIPAGVEDYLPKECKKKRVLEEKLRSLFYGRGFDEIETPTFEYYDVFSQGTGAYAPESMIKFFDRAGKILVLRPDLTIPIARVAGGALKETVTRLFYIQNAFGAEDINITNRSEYTQAGVEYLGVGGSMADAEIASLAVSALIACEIQNFKLEIGQVAFFKAIAKQAGLNEEETEEVRSLIDAKNTVELEYKLNQLELKAEDAERIKKIPSLFGGREVIERAREISDDEACQKALKDLDEVYEVLSKLGYEDSIAIDLGMLNKLNYYTGIVFRGICDDIGLPILSGGRYDHLLEEFGEKRDAIGFALGINRVMLALVRQRNESEEEAKCALVVSTIETAKEGYAFAENLRKEGMRVVFTLEEMNAEKYFPVYHI